MQGKSNVLGSGWVCKTQRSTNYAKNVPAGVPDIMSITTRSPEIADADIKPAIEQ